MKQFTLHPFCLEHDGGRFFNRLKPQAARLHPPQRYHDHDDTTVCTSLYQMLGISCLLRWSDLCPAALLETQHVGMSGLLSCQKAPWDDIKILKKFELLPTNVTRLRLGQRFRWAYWQKRWPDEQVNVINVLWSPPIPKPNVSIEGHVILNEDTLMLQMSDTKHWSEEISPLASVRPEYKAEKLQVTKHYIKHYIRERQFTHFWSYQRTYTE